jgi:RsiW-degrading membrane proteinase PrsW (M82 family)
LILLKYLVRRFQKNWNYSEKNGFCGQSLYISREQEEDSKEKFSLVEEFWMKRSLAVFSILLLVSNLAFAASVSDITAPITKIYDLIKGVVSVLGIIAITIAGAMYMFSGSNIQSRENAKHMVSYAIVGLVLVWIAPLIVGYLTMS